MFAFAASAGPDEVASAPHRRAHAWRSFHSVEPRRSGKSGYPGARLKIAVVLGNRARFLAFQITRRSIVANQTPVEMTVPVPLPTANSRCGLVSGPSPEPAARRKMRRKRPSVAALIVLVENNMVARDIHGMIALRDGSEEVRK